MHWALQMKRDRGQVALKRLHIILGSVMLRRTKSTIVDGKPIIVLPPKEVVTVKTDFLDE